jgi:hypothetical protein
MGKKSPLRNGNRFSTRIHGFSWRCPPRGARGGAGFPMRTVASRLPVVSPGPSSRTRLRTVRQRGNRADVFRLDFQESAVIIPRFPCLDWLESTMARWFHGGMHPDEGKERTEKSAIADFGIPIRPQAETRARAGLRCRCEDRVHHHEPRHRHRREERSREGRGKPSRRQRPRAGKQ